MQTFINDLFVNNSIGFWGRFCLHTAFSQLETKNSNYGGILADGIE